MGIASGRAGVAGCPNRTHPDVCGACLLEPSPHIVMAEAKPAVMVLFAKELELMCIKIRNRDRASRPQNAHHFPDGVRRSVDVVQIHVCDRVINGRSLDRQRVAAAQAALDGRVSDLSSQHGEHLRRLVDRDHSQSAAEQRLRHESGARTYIRGTAARLDRKRVERRLAHAHGEEPASQRVPVGRDGVEVGAGTHAASRDGSRSGGTRPITKLAAVGNASMQRRLTRTRVVAPRRSQMTKRARSSCFK
jgi:hypothetical protein